MNCFAKVRKFTKYLKLSKNCGKNSLLFHNWKYIDILNRRNNGTRLYYLEQCMPIRRI